MVNNSSPIKLINNTKIYPYRISISVITGFTYLWIVLPHIHNMPKAYDDVFNFIIQFNDTFLNKVSLKKVLKYFFYTDYPHQKIEAKLITILSYLIFGNINFKFILIVGHLFFISNIYFLYRICYNENILIYTSVLLTLYLPSWPIVHWSVAIWGFNSYLVLLTMIGYYTITDKYKEAVSATIISIFSLGSGFLNSAMGLIVYLYNLLKTRSFSNLKKFLFWTFLFFVGFTYAYSKQYMSESNSTPDLFHFDLIPVLNYVQYFLARGFLPDSIFETRTVVLIGYFFNSLILIFILFRFKSLKKFDIVIIAILLIIFTNGLITGMFRGDLKNFYSQSAYRYEVLSFYYLAIGLLFIHRSFSSIHKTLGFVISLFILIFSIYRFGNGLDQRINKIIRNEKLITDQYKNSLAKNYGAKKYIKLDKYLDSKIFSFDDTTRLQNFTLIENLDSYSRKIDDSNKYHVEIFNMNITEDFIYITGTAFHKNDKINHNLELILNFKTGTKEWNLKFQRLDLLNIYNYLPERKKLKLPKSIREGFNLFVTKSYLKINRNFGSNLLLLENNVIVKQIQLDSLASSL